VDPGEKPSYQQLKGVHCLQRLIHVLETAIEEKRKREELKAKRDLLFERYLKHPMDTRLALEIKIIDDQLAVDTKQAKGKTCSRNEVLSKLPLLAPSIAK